MLRLGCWDDVEDLVMVRLRPSRLASPLAGSSDRALVLDVGIAIGSGAIVPSPDLLDGWTATPVEIWRTALDNTRRKLPIEARWFAVAGFGITVVSGGLFTTGLVADPVAHLLRVGIEVPRDHLWVSALNASTVVVTTIRSDFRPHSWRDANGDHAETEASVSALHADLRAALDHRLPPNLFDFRRIDDGWDDVRGSFTSGRILE